VKREAEEDWGPLSVSSAAHKRLVARSHENAVMARRRTSPAFHFGAPKNNKFPLSEGGYFALL
jgi:hypothetical protein